jgi:ATP-dependent Clp protease adaptor protein ClpS
MMTSKGATKIKQETKQEIEKEQLYKVLLHNDDKTTMEFVVCVLMGIFEHTEQESERIMMAVHNSGIGIAGVYSLKVANNKVNQVHAIASVKGFPLKCSVEEE